MVAIRVTNNLRQIKAATMIQKHWRRVIAKKNYEIKIKAIVVIQSCIRSFIAKKLKKFLKETKSATIIQKWFRGCAQRKKIQNGNGKLSCSHIFQPAIEKLLNGGNCELHFFKIIKIILGESS